MGLSLEVNESETNSQRDTNSSVLQIHKNVDLNTWKLQLPNYDDLIPSSKVRLARTEILFDGQKTYSFVVFDTETASTARNNNTKYL